MRKLEFLRNLFLNIQVGEIMEKKLIGTVMSPVSNESATNIATLTYDLTDDFNAIIFARADNSKIGKVVLYEPTRLQQSRALFIVSETGALHPGNTDNTFYIAPRTELTNEITINYARWGGGFGLGYNKKFNVYTTKLDFKSLLEI